MKKHTKNNKAIKSKDPRFEMLNKRKFNIGDCFVDIMGEKGRVISYTIREEVCKGEILYEVEMEKSGRRNLVESVLKKKIAGPIRDLNLVCKFKVGDLVLKDKSVWKIHSRDHNSKNGATYGITILDGCSTRSEVEEKVLKLFVGEPYKYNKQQTVYYLGLKGIVDRTWQRDDGDGAMYNILVSNFDFYAVRENELMSESEYATAKKDTRFKFMIGDYVWCNQNDFRGKKLYRIRGRTLIGGMSSDNPFYKVEDKIMEIGRETSDVRETELSPFILSEEAKFKVGDRVTWASTSSFQPVHPFSRCCLPHANFFMHIGSFRKTSVGTISECRVSLQKGISYLVKWDNILNEDIEENLLVLATETKKKETKKEDKTSFNVGDKVRHLNRRIGIVCKKRYVSGYVGTVYQIRWEDGSYSHDGIEEALLELVEKSDASNKDVSSEECETFSEFAEMLLRAINKKIVDPILVASLDSSEATKTVKEMRIREDGRLVLVVRQ